MGSQFGVENIRKLIQAESNIINGVDVEKNLDIAKNLKDGPGVSFKVYLNSTRAKEIAKMGNGGTTTSTPSEGVTEQKIIERAKTQSSLPVKALSGEFEDGKWKSNKDYSKMEHGDFLNLKSPEVAEMLGYKGKKNSDGRLESITVDKDTGMPLTLKEDGTFENPDKAKVVSVDSPEFTMLMRARLQKEDYKDFKGEPKEESYDGKGLGYTDKDKAALFNSMKDAASGSVNLTYGEAISMSRVGKRKDNKHLS